MLGSAVLETAVGLAFLFFFLSMVVSGVNELLMAMLNQRARYLRAAVERLLEVGGSTELARRFFASPLIEDLRTPRLRLRGPPTDPSYLPPSVFADVVLGVVAGAASDDRAGSDDNRLTDAIELLPAAHPLRRALAAAATGLEVEMTQAWEELQIWFNHSMDRVTGWYRRHIRFMLAAIAAVLVLSLDLDAVEATRSLWLDDVTRAALVEEADTLLDTDEGSESGQEEILLDVRVEQLEEDLDALGGFGLDPGWGELPETAGDWGAKALGLMLMVVAITLGAPFWFDTLNRLAQVRAVGPSPDDRS